MPYMSLKLGVPSECRGNVSSIGGDPPALLRNMYSASDSGISGALPKRIVYCSIEPSPVCR